MALLRLFLKPGVDKQNTEYGAEGGWVDSDYVRFRYGLPEQIVRFMLSTVAHGLTSRPFGLLALALLTPPTA